MKKRYTAEEKARLVAEVRSSGDGVAAVAKRFGVAAATAYLWMKSTPAGVAPTFVQVVRTPDRQRSAMTIEIGGATIRVEPGFDADLFGAVVAALSSKT